jgi:hypothetical protein
MLLYWEQSAGGFQKEDSNTEVEDEDYVTQTIDTGQWRRRTDGRSWGQNNINFRISNDEPIVEW